MSLRLLRLLYRTSRLTVFTVSVFAFNAQAQNIDEVLGLPPLAAEAEPVTPMPVGAPPISSAPTLPPEIKEDVSDLLKKIESDEATKMQAPIAPQPAATAPVMPTDPEPEPAVPEGTAEVVNEADVPAPAPGALVAPEAEASVTIDVPAVPALPAGVAPDDNLFFDSQSLVPEGEMATTVPRKVNPQLEPGSKLIVVTREAGPGTPQAQLVSAQRAIALGRYDSALRIYNEMYKKDSRNGDVLLGRAVALQKLGQNDEAIRAYEQALDALPQSTEAQINMLGLVGQRYPAVALQRLNELSDDNPEDVRVLAQIAVVQARLGHYDDALGSLGVAASLDQDNALHVFNMGVVADRAGKKAQAIQYYEKALEIDTIYGGSRTIPREAVYERLAQLR
jgi:Flp pilus assembly protein TadD